MGVENSARILKGVNAIRYLYHPYHPWRHGYRREKIRRAAVKTARILLLLELLWLAYSCACSRMTEKTYLVPDIETGIPDGIGIEKGAGNLFWFHKEVHRTP